MSNNKFSAMQHATQEALVNLALTYNKVACDLRRFSWFTHRYLLCLGFGLLLKNICMCATRTRKGMALVYKKQACVPIKRGAAGTPSITIDHRCAWRNNFTDRGHILYFGPCYISPIGIGTWFQWLR